jgi:hypothetical protein
MSKVTHNGKKSFLECMFNDLEDIHEGTDKDVEKELLSAGVDIKKAHKSFQQTLIECKNRKRRQRLADARQERIASKDRVADFLEMIRRKALPIEDLIARVRELQPILAHRDFGGWSREDLESQLADLLAIQHRDSGKE